MSTPPNIKLKADVGRMIDGEAWKAMEDGRAGLEGSLWHLRQNWALEKADQIIARVMTDTGTTRTLEHWRQEVGKLHSQIGKLEDTIRWCLERDERNGSLPEAYVQKLRDALPPSNRGNAE